MELRSSSRRRNEYKELQITLNGMGFYEEGMELQEMRQILDALQMSVNEGETNFLECDMQQAIRESEMDFMPSQDGRVLNSTMMSIHPNISPCSSPELPSERIVVYAEVHHAMDWSPPNERLPRKRFASPSIAVNNEHFPPELELINELLEPDVKRFHDVLGPIPNINIQETNTNMGDTAENTADDRNIISENSLQEPTNCSHEIHGPISVRRIHDSGFNMIHEVPHSSFNSNTSNATNSESSVAELVNSNHEIRGPISVRRIHDSGLINELLEPDVKRFYDVPVPKPNINIQETNTNKGDNADSTAGDSNISENSFQEPTNNSHEIHGPISVRRIHDSGFNMSNEIPHSSFNSNTSNATNPSNASLNNMESSVVELANSNHEIRGPMSVRRIHDSGVNISCEMSHSTSRNNSNEYSLSNHSFENSEQQVSTSSAGNPYYFDDDSEPSI